MTVEHERKIFMRTERTLIVTSKLTLWSKSPNFPSFLQYEDSNTHPDLDTTNAWGPTFATEADTAQSRAQSSPAPRSAVGRWGELWGHEKI